MSSRADELRLQGNVLYKEILSSYLSGGYSTESKLEEADKYYKDALAVSFTAEKRASAYKNQGSLSFLWAKWVLKTSTSTLSKVDLTQCKERLIKSVSYYLEAWDQGKGNLTGWIYKLEELLIELIDWAAENEKNGPASADPSSEFTLMRSVCEAMNKPGQQCIVYCYAYARMFDLFFWRGVEILKELQGDDGDEKCLAWMGTCQLPLEKLRTWSKDSNMKDGIAATAQEWQEDIKKIISLIRDNQSKSQKRNLIEEREEEAAMRKDIQEKLRETVQILRSEASKTTEDYLRFIYANHTHPKLNFKLGNLSTPDETREAITTALRHYHPDRNIIHGLEWHYLCEEITRNLNNKYEFYK